MVKIELCYPIRHGLEPNAQSTILFTEKCCTNLAVVDSTIWTWIRPTKLHRNIELQCDARKRASTNDFKNENNGIKNKKRSRRDAFTTCRSLRGRWEALVGGSLFNLKWHIHPSPGWCTAPGKEIR